MTARDDFQRASNVIIDLYEQLQEQIFNVIIDALKAGDYKHVSQDDVVTWQAKQLAQIGRLNQQTVKLMADADGLSEQAVKDLITFHGLKIIDEVDDQLQDMSDESKPVSQETQDKLAAIVGQTWADLQNNVNESLVSRNYGATATTRVYRRILTESTLATVSGAMTHEKAVESAIYRAVDRGLPTKLVDKAGHNWSLEGYCRMVINTTVNRAYNELRLQRMKDYNMHLALMSSHPNSRPACAWIQGHVVNLVPPESPNYDDRYDSIYNHGYGTPAGTQGINCRHILFPYKTGVNKNHQPQYDPEKAIENGKLVQKQRARERAIRDAKKRLKAAEELGDVEMINKSKILIRARQASLRKFIKETNAGKKIPILARDYSREKVITGSEKQTNFIDNHRAKELAHLKQTYGPHGFPKDVHEYQKVLYNKDTGQAMHAYVAARQNRSIEPVVDYKHYVDTVKKFRSLTVGLKTQTGTPINGVSDHSIGRFFGARQDYSHLNKQQKPTRRVGTSVENIVDVLKNGKLVENNSQAEGYSLNGWKVVISKRKKTFGKVVTIKPQKQKAERKKRD